MSTVMNAPILDAGIASTNHEAFVNKPVTNDPDYVRFYHDFVLTDEYNTTNVSLTIVDGGSDAGQVNAVAAGSENGLLQITTNDADADSNALQWKVEGFKLVAGKKMWFDARCSISDVDDSEFLIGLCITDTTPKDASDGIYFRLTEADATGVPACITVKNSVQTSTSSQTTLVDSTQTRFSMYCDGVSTVKFYINSELVATHTTNINDDEEMAFSIFIESGSAATRTVYLDYVEVVKER